MSNGQTVIKVENISKCYRIGLKENMHDTLAKTALDLIKSPLSNYRKYRSLYEFDDSELNTGNNAGIIWALKNVSFEVKRVKLSELSGLTARGNQHCSKFFQKLRSLQMDMLKSEERYPVFWKLAPVFILN